MAYVGIQTQILRNNRNTTLLLLAFPVLLLAMVYVFLYFINKDKTQVGPAFVTAVPFVLAGTAIWFAIAYFSHTSLIRMATGAQPLERREHMRVYNLVENLCISQGMPMPKVYLIEDDSLNAYASGINEASYAVTLSRGIINKMNDAELEGVIAHELTHIRNRDVRLLIISIVFVGIFAFLAQIAMRNLFYAGGRRRDKEDNSGVIIIVAIAVTAIAYLISLLLRFGISRRREYMADAGAAEMTRNPLALASALRKISEDPYIEAVRNQDVAQLFIDHPSAEDKSSFSLESLFATHPPIDKRIKALEAF
ncbi:M48 family metallopeptidase [Taibaiella chishuiensis]|uniref:Heat shock protein n=1 Tax=Taibaiella chishuiensis TaxID=1434707 RepID=A0A2P8DAS3_9BACT|nr:M48 family metallopeptidase [Taibaiella chishuiensis]PSK94291.1 heat shock protein [Taibaiella chishuiensis]